MSDDVVTHKMFGQDGLLPCCGVHRLEVVQSDRIAIGEDQEVTCTGAKRYRAANRADRRKNTRTMRKSNGLWKPS